MLDLGIDSEFLQNRVKQPLTEWAVAPEAHDHVQREVEVVTPCGQVPRESPRPLIGFDHQHRASGL